MLTKLLDLAELQARAILIEFHQDLMPSWVIIDEDNNAVIRLTPWDNDQEKRLAEFFIRRELKRYKAKAYSFVTEAWAAEAPKDWDPNTPLPKHERASQRVDRREVVIAFATDGQKTEWRSWAIHRNWKGEIDTLEQQELDQGQLSSWMNELLKP